MLKAQTERRVFLKTGNCCRQGLSLVLFNPLPPRMSHSSSPYFCRFSVSFSLSYRSLYVSFFFVPSLTPQDFPSSLLVLLPDSSSTLPHLCISHFSSSRHFLFSHSLTQLSLHWPGIAFQNTAPSFYLLSVSSSGNIPAPLRVSNCCHCN